MSGVTVQCCLPTLAEDPAHGLDLAGPLVRRDECVMQTVRSSDERTDALLLKLEPTHCELDARTHGRHLLQGGSQPAHLHRSAVSVSGLDETVWLATDGRSVKTATNTAPKIHNFEVCFIEPPAALERLRDLGSPPWVTHSQCNGVATLLQQLHDQTRLKSRERK